MNLGFNFGIMLFFLFPCVRGMPVGINHARTMGRARWDLLTEDIDVCALLNSRVTIVQKVRRFTLWLYR